MDTTTSTTKSPFQMNDAEFKAWMNEPKPKSIFAMTKEEADAHMASAPTKLGSADPWWSSRPENRIEPKPQTAADIACFVQRTLS